MRIYIKAKPGSKEEKVVKTDEENFIVSVKERPIQGRANDAIVRALAKHFGVPTYCVKILAGERAKRKIVEITK